MKNLVNKIFVILSKKRVKQVGSLYLSMIISLIVGIGVSVVNTRLLGKEVYGDLKFLQNAFAFALTFVTLGLFYSGGRLVAKERNPGVKVQLFGNMFVIASLMSLLLTGVFLIFSYPQEQIFDNKLGYYFRLFSPLLLVFPFQMCIENILQGDNRIYTLSIFRLGPKVLYLASALIFTYFFAFTLISALFLHLLTILVLILIIGFRLKPVLRRTSKVFKAIWSENKTYGFPVYTGAITSTASTQIAGFTISYFIDNTNVGYFYLAVTATMTLSMIPSTAGTTFFKDFVDMDRIPRTVFLTTLMITLLALAGFLLIIKPVVIFLYTEEYISVVSLAYYMAFAATFQGLGDFFNRFISAHGYGNKLRNSSFIIGAFNILGYTLIVLKLGVEGAVITRLLAGVLYFGLMLRIYTKIR